MFYKFPQGRTVCIDHLVSDSLGISFQHTVVQGKKKRLKYVAAPKSSFFERGYSEKICTLLSEGMRLEMRSTSWSKMVMLIGFFFSVFHHPSSFRHLYFHISYSIFIIGVFILVGFFQGLYVQISACRIQHPENGNEELR